MRNIAPPLFFADFSTPVNYDCDLKLFVVIHLYTISSPLTRNQLNQRGGGGGGGGGAGRGALESIMIVICSCL